MKLRVAVISQGESDNLGDAAIFRALEQILSLTCDVRLIPLADDRPPDQTSRARLSASRLPGFAMLAERLSPRVKAVISWHFFGGSRAFASSLTSQIHDVDFVLIGGGQLLNNNVALFCKRLGAAQRVLAATGTPYALLGVGVSENMTRGSWRDIQPLVKLADSVIARDQTSARELTAQIRRTDSAQTVPDLAYALDSAPWFQESKPMDNTIAINVMDIRGLQLSGAKYQNPIGHMVDNFYRNLIRSVIGKGFTPALFTSGSSADLVEAFRVRDLLLEHGVRLEVFHPESLDELLGYLSKKSRVLALRLHAGILAHVAGANPVCVCWDRKVRDVWASVGQEQRVIGLRSVLEGDSWQEEVFAKWAHGSTASLRFLADQASRVRAETVSGIRILH